MTTDAPNPTPRPNRPSDEILLVLAHLAGAEDMMDEAKRVLERMNPHHSWVKRELLSGNLRTAAKGFNATRHGVKQTILRYRKLLGSAEDDHGMIQIPDGIGPGDL